MADEKDSIVLRGLLLNSLVRLFAASTRFSGRIDDAHRKGYISVVPPKPLASSEPNDALPGTTIDQRDSPPQVPWTMTTKLRLGLVVEGGSD